MLMFDGSSSTTTNFQFCGFFLSFTHSIASQNLLEKKRKEKRRRGEKRKNAYSIFRIFNQVSKVYSFAQVCLYIHQPVLNWMICGLMIFLRLHVRRKTLFKVKKKAKENEEERLSTRAFFRIEWMMAIEEKRIHSNGMT